MNCCHEPTTMINPILWTRVHRKKKQERKLTQTDQTLPHLIHTDTFWSSGMTGSRASNSFRVSPLTSLISVLCLNSQAPCGQPPTVLLHRGQSHSPALHYLKDHSAFSTLLIYSHSFSQGKRLFPGGQRTGNRQCCQLTGTETQLPHSFSPIQYQRLPSQLLQFWSLIALPTFEHLSESLGLSRQVSFPFG